MCFTWCLGCLDFCFTPVLSAPTWSSVLIVSEERGGPGRCASGSHPRTPPAWGYMCRHMEMGPRETTHVLALSATVQTSWLTAVYEYSFWNFPAPPHAKCPWWNRAKKSFLHVHFCPKSRTLGPILNVHLGPKYPVGLFHGWDGGHKGHLGP